MSEEHAKTEQINYRDDNSMLSYLLHNVKGLSPVSGGVLGEALEYEYAEAEFEAAAGDDIDFTADA